MKILLFIIALGLSVSAFGESIEDMIRRTQELAKPGQEQMLQLQKNNCEKLKNSYEQQLNEYAKLPDDIGKAVMMKDLQNGLIEYKQLCRQFGEVSSSGRSIDLNSKQSEKTSSNTVANEDRFSAFLVLGITLFLLWRKGQLRLK
jgi:hypothetical protein